VSISDGPTSDLESDRLRFATGWNYFFKYAIVLPNNLTAAGIILQYWRPDLNVAIWVTIFGVCIVVLNVCSSHRSKSSFVLLSISTLDCTRQILWRSRILVFDSQGCCAYHAHHRMPGSVLGRFSVSKPCWLRILESSWSLQRISRGRSHWPLSWCICMCRTSMLCLYRHRGRGCCVRRGSRPQEKCPKGRQSDFHAHRLFLRPRRFGSRNGCPLQQSRTHWSHEIQNQRRHVSYV